MSPLPELPPSSEHAPAMTGREHARLHGPALWLGLAAALVAIFFVRLSYYVFHDVADGLTGTLGARVFEEITGAATAIAIIPPSVWIARRAFGGQIRAMRAGALLVGGFVVMSAAHTLLMLVSRALLAPALGIEGYELHLTLSRFAYEMANDVLPFAAIFAGLGLADGTIARRHREARARELERTLLESELRSLRLQLQPHFLFNALNTISDAIYDDPARADALLGHLADLLRTSLRTTHAQEVALRDELALVEQYLALMRARFGERLQVVIRTAPGVEGLLVPSMLLQPLVENAIRHGGVAEAGRGHVVVTIGTSADGECLELRVHDDGPGARGRTVPADADAEGGTGLSATARRLALLYGQAHELQAGDAPEGGFAVRIAIPARPAGAPPWTDAEPVARPRTAHEGDRGAPTVARSSHP